MLQYLGMTFADKIIQILKEIVFQKAEIVLNFLTAEIVLMSEF